MTLLNILFMTSLGCEEDTKCEASQPLISINKEADFVYEGEINIVNYPNGTARIEVWDCVDVSWWGPVEEQKVVQIQYNENDCGTYDDVDQLLFLCGDEGGPDQYLRDEDGDGYFRNEDCDDRDENIGLCDEDAEESETINE